MNLPELKSFLVRFRHRESKIQHTVEVDAFDRYESVILAWAAWGSNQPAHRYIIAVDEARKPID